MVSNLLMCKSNSLHNFVKVFHTKVTWHTYAKKPCNFRHFDFSDSLGMSWEVRCFDFNWTSHSWKAQAVWSIRMGCHLVQARHSTKVQLVRGNHFCTEPHNTCFHWCILCTFTALVLYMLLCALRSCAVDKCNMPLKVCSNYRHVTNKLIEMHNQRVFSVYMYN